MDMPWILVRKDCQGQELRLFKSFFFSFFLSKLKKTSDGSHATTWIPSIDGAQTKQLCGVVLYFPIIVMCHNDES